VRCQSSLSCPHSYLYQMLDIATAQG
jgi:hypothetical protein